VCDYAAESLLSLFFTSAIENLRGKALLPQLTAKMCLCVTVLRCLNCVYFSNPCIWSPILLNNWPLKLSRNTFSVDKRVCLCVMNILPHMKNTCRWSTEAKWSAGTATERVDSHIHMVCETSAIVRFWLAFHPVLGTMWRITWSWQSHMNVNPSWNGFSYVSHTPSNSLLTETGLLSQAGMWPLLSAEQGARLRFCLATMATEIMWDWQRPLLLKCWFNATHQGQPAALIYPTRAHMPKRRPCHVCSSAPA